MHNLQELTLELTNWCPLKCLHCSSLSGIETNEHLTGKIAMQLVKEAAFSGASKISFGGGEPTAIRIFLPALKYAVDLGMLAEVFTCGCGRSGKKVTSLSTSLIENCKALKGIKFIFSIYGATSDIHDFITQTKGGYEKAVMSLKRCIDAGIECEINFVPLKPNANQIRKIVEFAKTNGVSKINILRFVPQGRGYDNRELLELSLEEEDSFIASLLEIRKFGNILIRTGSPYNDIVPNNNVPCRAGNAKIVVQANGNILPCEVYKHHDRHDWGLSAYSLRIKDVLKHPEIIRLINFINCEKGLKCPIHSRLRSKLMRTENEPAKASA